MRNWIKISFTVFVFLSLAVFVVFTDVDSVFKQVSSIGYNFIYILLISAAAYLAGTIAWQYCFSQSSIPLSKLFYTRTVGEVITLFNPTNIVAGEAFKYFALKSDVTNKSDVFDSILISRTIMIISQVALSVFCIIYMFYGGLNIKWLWQVITIVSPVLVVVYGVYRVFKSSIRNIMKSLCDGTRLRAIYENLKTIRRRLILQVRKHPKRIVLAFFWTIMHWLLGAIEIFLILYLLNIPIDLISSLCMDMGVVLMKSLAGFIPGQIGVEELSNRMMLNLIGLPIAGLWLTVSLIRRAKQFFWICISFLLYYGNQFLTQKKYQNGDTLCNS